MELQICNEVGIITKQKKAAASYSRYLIKLADTNDQIIFPNPAFVLFV